MAHPALAFQREGLLDETDRATVNGALERIEQERQGRAYLVGDAFTVADLTAAAMLSPLLQPPEFQYPLRVELPPYLQDYRAAVIRVRTAGRRLSGSVTLHRDRGSRGAAATERSHRSRLGEVVSGRSSLVYAAEPRGCLVPSGCAVVCGALVGGRPDRSALRPNLTGAGFKGNSV